MKEDVAASNSDESITPNSPECLRVKP
jgi:hypothetical protein